MRPILYRLQIRGFLRQMEDEVESIASSEGAEKLLKEISKSSAKMYHELRKERLNRRKIEDIKGTKYV